jgi:hypothetical protein
MRALRLYQSHPDLLLDEVSRYGEGEALLDERVHARSRFRSSTDPARFALYSVHDAPHPDILQPPRGARGNHTLIVVREFRRVPLHATALGLMVFTARPGNAARLVAALAHFVERAVSLYQPPYLLLAHSLEDPCLSTLLMGVHEASALQAASPTAFSLDPLLPEVEALLEEEPEWYAYCPETLEESPVAAVSPYAV